jgi:hypothetical protein
MKKMSESDRMRRNWVVASRKRAKLLRHLIVLLRPHAATDPLMPDLCEELALGAEDQSLLDVALEIAQLGLESASQQWGTPHARTRRASGLVKSYKGLVANT